jgi:Domain of unknown function (DUF4832)
MKMATAISTLMAGLAISISPALRDGGGHAANSGGGKTQSASPAAKSPAAPQCKIAGKGEITITCEYEVTPRSSLDNTTEPRIALNRSLLSFKTNDDSRMHVELTFTNEGVTRVSDVRSVYLAINDERGQNHMRRALPHADFRKIEPGQALTFQDTLIAPAFSQGHYIIFLWIPASDSSLEFDPAHNLLLNNRDVANPVTGLNTLATFKVER